MVTMLPVAPKDCQYYLFPDLLYNGNRIGRAAHYFGEDFPEDAVTIPAGYSVEDADQVYGEWVSPQRGGPYPQVSVRLQNNSSSDRVEATYLMPPSLQFGQDLGLDLEEQFTVQNGLSRRNRSYQRAALQPKGHRAGDSLNVRSWRAEASIYNAGPGTGRTISDHD